MAGFYVGELTPRETIHSIYGQLFVFPHNSATVGFGGSCNGASPAGWLLIT